MSAPDQASRVAPPAADSAPPRSITVSTTDPHSAVDAVASLAESLASKLTPALLSDHAAADAPTAPTTTPQPTAAKPPLSNVASSRRPSGGSIPAAAAAAAHVPHYALPTAASLHREAATAALQSPRGLADGGVSPASTASAPAALAASSWLREPTVPKSPKFAIAGGPRPLRRRASVGHVHFNGTAGSKGVAKTSRASMAPNKLRRAGTFGIDRAVTVPKSPNLRSRGAGARASMHAPTPLEQQQQLEKELQKRVFTPNPLPAYLIQANVLPDIRLNVKTVAAMERRANPSVGAAAPRPQSPPKPPTVPQPFELRGVDKHAQYWTQLDAERAKLDEQQRKQRIFQARKVNDAILDGPTFVPTKSDTPLTQPRDLLPCADERSQRTLAFEARQRERIEMEQHYKLEAKREREAALVEQAAMVYEQTKFKPRAVPKSTYQPDLQPTVPIKAVHKEQQHEQQEVPSSAAAALKKRHSVSPTVMGAQQPGAGAGRRRTVSDDFRPTKGKGKAGERDSASRKSSVGAGVKVDMNKAAAVMSLATVSESSTGGRATNAHSKGRHIRVSDTSVAHTPVASTVTMEGQVDENSRKQVNKDGNVMSMTSETSQSQDSSSANSRGGGLLQKVKQSLSPLLG